MIMEKDTDLKQDVISYEKNKIQVIFDILNSVNFVGIQQAQAITQIALILGSPLPLIKKNEKSGDK